MPHLTIALLLPRSLSPQITPSFFQTKSVILSGTIRLHFEKYRLIIRIDRSELVWTSHTDHRWREAIQTQLALATTPTESSWTVSFDTANRIIFTHPSSGSATIPADQFVNIAIGTHASNQASGLNQMTNAATTGRKDAALFVGTDAHLFWSVLFEDAALNSERLIPCVNPGGNPSTPPAIPVAALTGAARHNLNSDKHESPSNRRPPRRTPRLRRGVPQSRALTQPPRPRYEVYERPCRHAHRRVDCAY